MIKKFESIFVRLIEQILLNFEVNPEETFQQFNFIDSDDEVFD